MTGHPTDSTGPREQAREWLQAARRPLVLTGAGVSAESGVPTFRGPDGMWRGHRPEELATPDAFSRDPEMVWEFYRWRRSVLRGCAPNPAHVALARYESSHPDLLLVTQNVDGLHRLAGSTRIQEIHGRLMIDRCSACGLESDASPRDEADRRIPMCGSCGAICRPGVVWFGEPVPLIGSAFEAAGSADLVLVVGTSGVVEPAASVARVARSAGAEVIEVNPEATPLSALSDLSLRGKAAELLPELLS